MKCTLKCRECESKNYKTGNCEWPLEGVEGHHCSYAEPIKQIETKKPEPKKKAT